MQKFPHENSGRKPWFYKLTQILCCVSDFVTCTYYYVFFSRNKLYSLSMLWFIMISRIKFKSLFIYFFSVFSLCKWLLYCSRIVCSLVEEWLQTIWTGQGYRKKIHRKWWCRNLKLFGMLYERSFFVSYIIILLPYNKIADFFLNIFLFVDMFVKLFSSRCIRIVWMRNVVYSCGYALFICLKKTFKLNNYNVIKKNSFFVSRYFGD